eukprot:CAMPEP_0198610770 /NCGR_PEP_ID=MMETSP1462-20131121/157062_1 /TAXON_ID=1333877 /ORGANISM="Brandtodinium nutriculum, Strain RCC3387" /LENGTH=328 /DNA_ID=CAMNT_0044342575 /DNA_START=56 /DNA_END=1042 /DNA_ORIENTATION=+
MAPMAMCPLGLASVVALAAPILRAGATTTPAPSFNERGDFTYHGIMDGVLSFSEESSLSGTTPSRKGSGLSTEGAPQTTRSEKAKEEHFTKAVNEQLAKLKRQTLALAKIREYRRGVAVRSRKTERRAEAERREASTDAERSAEDERRETSTDAERRAEAESREAQRREAERQQRVVGLCRRIGEWSNRRKDPINGVGRLDSVTAVIKAYDAIKVEAADLVSSIHNMDSDLSHALKIDLFKKLHSAREVAQSNIVEQEVPFWIRDARNFLDKVRQGKLQGKGRKAARALLLGAEAILDQYKDLSKIMPKPISHELDILVKRLEMALIA